MCGLRVEMMSMCYNTAIYTVLYYVLLSVVEYLQVYVIQYSVIQITYYNYQDIELIISTLVGSRNVPATISRNDMITDRTVYDRNEKISMIQITKSQKIHHDVDQINGVKFEKHRQFQR